MASQFSSRRSRRLWQLTAPVTTSAVIAAALSATVAGVADADPRPDNGEGTVTLTNTNGTAKGGDTLMVTGSGFENRKTADNPALSIKLFTPDSGAKDKKQVVLPTDQPCAGDVDGSGTLTITDKKCLPLNTNGIFTVNLKLPEELEDGQYEIRVLGSPDNGGGVSKHVLFDVKEEEPSSSSEKPSSSSNAAKPPANNEPTSSEPSSESSTPSSESESGKDTDGPVTGTNPSGDVSVTINKGTFAPGETVTVNGAGFLGKDKKGGVQPVLKLDGGNDAYDYGGPDAVKPSEFQGVPMFKSKEDGTFQGTVTLPEDITLGEHHFRVLAGSFGAEMPSTSFKVPFTVKEGEAAGTDDSTDPTGVNVSASVGVNGSNDAKPGEEGAAKPNASQAPAANANAKPNATSGALASTGSKILIPLLIVIVVAAAIAGVMAYLRRNRNEQY